MGTRHKGRILAFQALFAWDIQRIVNSRHTIEDKGQALQDLLDFSWVEGNPSPQAPNENTTAFPRILVAGTIENIKTIDSMIRKHLQNWDFSRLNGVDKALLRLSVYELMFQTAPPSVIIDEAIDISREYGTDDSYRFINGVLDGVRKTIQNDPGR
jgi:N utilization substance protein B